MMLWSSSIGLILTCLQVVQGFAIYENIVGESSASASPWVGEDKSTFHVGAGKTSAADMDHPSGHVVQATGTLPSKSFPSVPKSSGGGKSVKPLPLGTYSYVPRDGKEYPLGSNFCSSKGSAYVKCIPSSTASIEISASNSEHGHENTVASAKENGVCFYRQCRMFKWFGCSDWTQCAQGASVTTNPFGEAEEDEGDGKGETIVSGCYQDQRTAFCFQI